ncbi:MAG: 50S ribosomal protein L24 [Nanoarchaeota archaeon]
MKKKFSTKWKASSQVRKQRKYRFNAPLHIKQKFMASNLSKDLRKKMEKRNIEVRKGDVVKVMRGKLAGKSGKVASVDLKKQRVTIEGLQNQKKDGTKINVYFNPSKIQITDLGEGRNKGKEKKVQEIKQPASETKSVSDKKKNA